MDKNIETEKINIDFECTACKKNKQMTDRIPVSRIIDKLDALFSKNNLTEAEKLLEYWQKEAEVVGDRSGELSVINEMLGLFRRSANKVKAEKAVERAEELIELTGMTDSVSGATIMLNAATTCKAFEDYDKAIKLYGKTAAIYEKRLDKCDPRYAAFYNNYATALVDLKRFDEALVLYKKAVEITCMARETLLDCAVTYVNMAHLYDDWMGAESNDIAECLDKAEEILEDPQIEHGSYYAFVCEKCAPSFDYFGYFILAERLHNTARDIYERN